VFRGDGGDSPPSLDYRTKLARGRWRVAVYPDAGEAVATFQSAAGIGPSYGVGSPATGADPSAERRAKRNIRRYCAANRLAYLWDATYAASDDARFDPRSVRSDIRTFFRRLRRVLGRTFPYLWVTEWHKTGHGLHIHFALDQYVAHATVRDVWGHGYVFVRGPRRRVAARETRRQARRVARYVAKYVAKDTAAAGGLHRYEVAQGFQPQIRVAYAATAEEALKAAALEMGCEPVRTWDSASNVNWTGPHAVGAEWD